MAFQNRSATLKQLFLTTMPHSDSEDIIYSKLQDNPKPLLNGVMATLVYDSSPLGFL